MLPHQLVLWVALSMAGQFPNQTTYTRVAVDRNDNYVISAWNNLAQTQVYTSNGNTFPGALPDVDVDDSGNYALVFHAPDPNNNNNPSVYLSVNGGSPIDVYPGAQAHVTISRANGYIAITWLQGPGGTLRGPILAATYQYNTATHQVTMTSAPFTVNATVASSTYQTGDVSSDSTGNYVVTYIRNNASPGLLAARYQVNSETPIFPETYVFTGADVNYGHAQVACWSNGESVVTYNSTDGVSAFHVDGGGALKAHVDISKASVVDMGPSSDYPNDNGIACLRSTPGSYVVTWPTKNPAPPGVWGNSMAYDSNIVYWEVNNDQLAPQPTFVTHITGPTMPAYWNFTPGVALSDSPAVIWIVWSYYANSVETNEQASFAF